MVTGHGPPRRTYRMTQAGRRALDEWIAVMHERARLIDAFLDGTEPLERGEEADMSCGHGWHGCGPWYGPYGGGWHEPVAWYQEADWPIRRRPRRYRRPEREAGTEDLEARWPSCATRSVGWRPSS